MKKKSVKKVLNMVVALLFAIYVMSGSVIRVSAYTADTSMTGYPYVFDQFMIAGWNDSGFLFNDYAIASDQNTYYLDIPLSENVIQLVFGNNDSSFVFPYDSSLYDYYFIGTIMAGSGSTFDLSAFRFHYYNSSTDFGYESFPFQVYPFNNRIGNGISFSVDLTGFSEVNTNLNSFFLGGDFDLSGRLWFSGSIIPVPKSGSDADTLNSILEALNQINQNIITGNTLQQQTIDAINQNTTNTTNWFTTLISNLSTWYYQRKEDLSNWFLDIDNRLSSGFAALYSQMTREQDEKLNGYDDTTQSDAAASFSSESDKLTSLEGELSTQGNDFVNDYTSDGFDTGVLTTLGSSLIFVATWFTNFWNMGGVFTATLNLCFALSIVFFIFRIKR